MGNPVKLRTSQFNFTQFKPFEIDFYHSGTAALAAAIVASNKLKPNLTSKPEVILPAYGCPDLISAILYAGATPVLVDLAPDSSWMSLQQIVNTISENTIAMLAVRFLGIPERMDELLSICRNHKITLIEDSAQGFPVTSPDSYWRGDFTILSFGRGKPVNLLAGGAVLSRDPDLHTLLPIPALPDSSRKVLIKYLAKTTIYNLLINPVAYGLVSKLPGLNIGETTYKPLNELVGMPQYIHERLNANISSYIETRNVASLIRDSLSSMKTIELIDLALASNYDYSNPLLRYPLLVKNMGLRDLLYSSMLSLGASIMYKQPLYRIKAIPKELLSNSKHPYPNAQALADRLITLPTHLGVSNDIIIRMKTHIVNILKSATT